MRLSTLLLRITFVLSLLIYIFSFRGKETINHKKNIAEQDNEALGAMQFLSAGRAYPNAEVPEQGFIRAYDFYQKNFSKQNQKIASTSSWENIGPVNVGGRTLCIAIDPLDTAKVWLGSASGGLWKSTTGGTGFNAWTYVPISLPVLGVSSIAIHPSNPQIMYIGTGETYNYGTSTNGLVDRTTRGTPGIGILKSTDGGSTWNYSLNWSYSQIRGVWEILLNPKNPNILYAATTEGVYKSNDAGANWTNILAHQMVMDIAIDKVDTNIVYACAGNFSTTAKGIYKTSNSGTSWNLLGGGLPAFTNDGRISISLYPKNNKIMIAQIANMYSTMGIYKSINEGVNWTSCNVTATEIVSYQGWYAQGLLFNSADSTKVLASGVELFRSSDYGSTLNQVSNLGSGFDFLHSDIHAIISNPLDANKIYIATDGGLFRSDNFGDTYYECTNGYVTAQCYIGSVSSTDTTVMLTGLQDNYTQKYNGNQSWTGAVGGDGSFNTIDPDNDFHQVCSNQYLNVYTSTDQGFNFNYVFSNAASPTGGNTSAFLAPFVYCPSDPQTMYAGNDHLWNSTDGGNNWNTVNPAQVDNGNKIISIAVSAMNLDSLYIATAPEGILPMNVFRSVNGGINLTSISAGLPNRYPRRIAVNPKNSKEVYIVFSGFGSGHIFKSVNAGNSWTDISTSLPDIPFHSILVHPLHPDTIFAGSDLGMYVSPDRGNSWTSFNQGFPTAVMVFDIVYATSTNTLLAFTHGHGVYKKEMGSSGPSSIAESRNRNLKMNLFPNPANESVTIDLANESSETASISILNMEGKVMESKEIKSVSDKQHITFLTANFKNGTYLIVMSNGKERSTAKLLVMH